MFEGELVRLGELSPALFFLVVFLVVIVLVWSVVLKGLALWHSARRDRLGWFVIFLLVNTLGILELVFLFGVAKLRCRELFTRGGALSQNPPTDAA